MENIDIAVIGGGPAGLRAAEVSASSGRKVVVFDGKPSVGRKFLVAGKGGLNLTHGEGFERFVERYSGEVHWREILRGFSPEDLTEWCHELGQETFQASSGRIYPKALKGAPVLRAWLGRLAKLDVEIRPRHQWTDLEEGGVLTFSNGEKVRAGAVVFALGGGSWPKTGSDGNWVEKFNKLGIRTSPLVSSNCGWECDWAGDVLERAEGLPIKNIVARAGGTEVVGELLLTRYGLEGGAVYALGRELRGMESPEILIDFKPTFTVDQLIEKLGQSDGDLLKAATRKWRLSIPAVAILSSSRFQTAVELAVAAKSCRIRLNGPRPIEEAISSAGGVGWSELNDCLMLKKYPGVFVCGEMIDWDAPTGGYLLQGAFSTGTMAGKAAAGFGR